MSANKTVPTCITPAVFLDTVMPMRRREDGKRLEHFFSDVTGFAPVMWGASIVGYGRYHYRYASGREGDFLATGFSPRKTNLSIYIMPGYQEYSEILSRLGKHKLGKSCLYVNSLADIDMDVLAELVRTGLQDLNEIWKVTPE